MNIIKNADIFKITELSETNIKYVFTPKITPKNNINTSIINYSFLTIPSNDYVHKSCIYSFINIEELLFINVISIGILNKK